VEIRPVPPKADHEAMIIGINQFLDAKYLRLNYLLIQPFLGKAEL
jgi:hypothetical protein